MPSHPLSLAHKRVGSAAVTPAAQLVFTHANGFCKEMWFPTLDDLSRKLPDHLAYDSLLMDLTGHGGSRDRTNNFPRPLQWEHFTCTDVLEAVDTLPKRSGGGPRVVGVGHSLGGAGLVYAELARPGTFDALILMEPILPPPDERIDGKTDQRALLAAGASKRRVLWPTREEARKSLRSKALYAAFEERVFNNFVDYGTVETAQGCQLQCTGDIEAEIYRGSGRCVWHELHKVNCPVWFLCGANTFHMEAWGKGSSVAVFRALSEKFPRSTFELLPNLAHFAPFEDPTRYAEILAGALVNVWNVPKREETGQASSAVTIPSSL
mmetsp:Transcript_60324/g.127746  ORF Transcript_60324/g.127746 Transcript_60324/m.127746 type:complete len:323 (+) Transcript_60324:74-1042(+)|eukprot:CAMPEP_0206452278 /NCGR_PEP_ID=MMETSP0324_2-20121206/19855_1 /ASSEMBLY_ACC=CAM_ASM_000836 /TAXON_ID=2866 /ORGANISM="Crypthecodinium cohnii, Strain Seligo" /LENGTH=322 /DNA_ID=CAMNT_0053922347 /DNA_START=58 /DNA_END=1026 /DNA_ORIENTATION=-